MRKRATGARDPSRSRGAASPALTRRQSTGAPSARSLLLTVLGEYVLPVDRPVWTSTFVTVLGGLGVEEKAARQALARTANHGWITPAREGRRVRWDLTAPGRRLLTEGAERIYSFAAEGASWDGRWLVLTVNVPETQRQLRHQLRTRLAWAGFGCPAPGLWITPASTREAEAKQILHDLDLAEQAFSFTGPFSGIGSAKYLVEQAWNLKEVAAHYSAFLAAFAHIDPVTGEETMRAQIRLVHEWRRFPFLDPQLPTELLPPHWIGKRAAALFRDRHLAWHTPAQQHWRTVIDAPGR